MFAYVLPRFEAQFPAVELWNVASDAGHGGGQDEAGVGPVLAGRLLHDAVVEDLSTHEWQCQSLTASQSQVTDGVYINTTLGRSYTHCIKVRFIPDFAIPSSSSSIYWTGPFQGVKSPIEACALGGRLSVLS